MSLQITVEGIVDTDARGQIEGALRGGVGDPPTEEEWTVVAVSVDGGFVVLLKTPRQSRTKLFFQDVSQLPDAIRTWLKLHPVS